MNSVANEINDILKEQNPVAEEIEDLMELRRLARNVFAPSLVEIEEYVSHTGVAHDENPPGRGSGRFEYGSGENPYQHADDFVTRVRRLRLFGHDGKGMTDAEIAEELHIIGKSGKPSSGRLKAQYAAAINDQKLQLYSKFKELRDKGKTYQEIAELTGVAGESTVREVLNHPTRIERAQAARTTAEYLKAMIKENPKAVIDVGEDSSGLINISQQKLDEALYLLEQEGYNVYSNYKVPQATNKGKLTTMKVLAGPDFKERDLYVDPDTHEKRVVEMRMITDDAKRMLYDNGNELRPAFQYPESLDSKRLAIRYAEDGGKEADGLIELRRGVKDLSLGDSNYAQVRIMVDGTHYLKGMAVYSDDLPDGIDVRFNTNKTKDVPALGPKDNTVLKPIKKDDPDNPFNSLIKEKGGQYWYKDDDGKEHLGLINKRSDQGDWTDWEDALPSQFLSKQPKKLIKQQLDISLKDREEQLNDILSITNPVIRENRLLAFADGCDSAAVALKAAPLPNQKWHVILPVSTMSENEVFAPQYENGTRVALIRYPHGGTFEIPELVVNNNNKKARKMIGMDSIDGCGINAKVAERLSGADFDGDTVMIIPITSRAPIKSSSPLPGLVGFDPQVEYAGYPGMKHLSKKATQPQMGIISNLITDMTIKGAKPEELARAVRHSMVVIDADKHNLDYERSYVENGIEELKRIYQPNPDNKKGYGGAGTLISRAKSEVHVPLHKGAPRIDEDGNLYYNTAPDSERFYEKRKPVYQKDAKGRIIKDKDGKPVPEMAPDSYGNMRPVYEKTGKIGERDTKSTKMAETKDARTLSSGYEVEELYAAYANNLKDMARTARKASLKTEGHVYKKEAAEAYKEEVAGLNAQLENARRNKPFERMAQSKTYMEVQEAIRRDENLYKNEAEIKKISDRTLKKNRAALGARRQSITISPKQWEAIESGAVRKETLKQILRYADDGEIDKYAMPRRGRSNELSPITQSRIRTYANSNYSIAQIANAIGCSQSTVYKYLHQKEGD